MFDHSILSSQIVELNFREIGLLNFREIKLERKLVSYSKLRNLKRHFLIALFANSIYGFFHI